MRVVGSTDDDGTVFVLNGAVDGQPGRLATLSESGTEWRSSELPGIPRDVATDNAELSRQHAVFSRMDDAYLVKDLGTSNGTFVNEQPVQSQKLQNKDVVRVASLEFHFYRIARNPASPRASSAARRARWMVRISSPTASPSTSVTSKTG